MLLAEVAIGYGETGRLGAGGDGAEHPEVDAPEQRYGVMETRVVIDSIQSQIVRVESADGSLYTIPRSWMPANAKEGDVLTLKLACSEDGETTELRFTVDSGATEERRRTVRAKLNQLRERKP